MKIQPLIVIVILFGASICFNLNVKGQNQYSISNQIDTCLLNSKILFPDRNDKELDSIESKILADTNGIAGIRSNLENNIAVIYFYENDSLLRYNNSSNNFDCFPALVQALFYKDTLRITTGIGYFAGSGIVINISKDKYESFYFEDADNDLVFKYNKDDKDYIAGILVKAFQENLLLNKSPTLVKGEILFGQYEGNLNHFMKNNIVRIRLKGCESKLFLNIP